MSYTPPRRRLRSAGGVQDSHDLSSEPAPGGRSRAPRESPEGDDGSPTEFLPDPVSPQHSETPRSPGESDSSALRTGSPRPDTRSVDDTGFSSTPFDRDMVTGPDRYLPIPTPAAGQRVPPFIAPGPVRPVGADSTVENPHSLLLSGEDPLINPVGSEEGLGLASRELSHSDRAQRPTIRMTPPVHVGVSLETHDLPGNPDDPMMRDNPIFLSGTGCAHT